MDTWAAPVRIRHILHAADADQASGLAVEAAQALADRLGARLTRIAVPPAASGAGPGRGSVPAAGAHASGLTGVAEGIPDIEIVRSAEAIMADLILMIRPSGAAAGGTLQAERQDAVVRRVDVPCLILPAGQTRFGQLRVALDGSERGMRALRVAWSLRKLPTTGLSAIHVQPARGDSAVWRAAPASTAGARLEGWIRQLVRPARPPVLLSRNGDVVQEVLRDLSESDGDLLAVGVRRGGPADRDESTGSGRRILAAARCGVLTVPL
jgi:nucleotide-binding universal stress UspA family protein